MHRKRMVWSTVFLSIAVVVSIHLGGVFGTRSRAQPPVTKVLVLGFDGADGNMVERLMREGRLPHLAKLARQGTFRKLLPTNPPQTPVSWSSMATGLLPGRTGIFDFLKRDRRSYFPTFALLEESGRPFLLGKNNAWVFGGGAGLVLGLFAVWIRKRRRGWKPGLVTGGVVALVGGLLVGWVAHRTLPERLPRAVNHRHGLTIWKYVDAQGYRVKVVRYPTTFPADAMAHGNMLSGLGVPDIRGTIGQPTIYTDDASLLARANDFSLKIELIDIVNATAEIDTVVWGPRNKLYCDTRQRSCREYLKRRGLPIQIREPLKLRLDLDRQQVTITYRNQTATLRVGEWSDWFVFTFRITPIVRIKAIGRFYLLSTDPFFRLYLSPLHFHPESHPIPFSWPPDWSEWLFRQVGLFKTMGWAIDTWTISSGLSDEDHFLQDVYFTVNKYREIMRTLIPKNDWDLYIQVYSFTDRVQHILWRLIDPEHPMYDPKRAQRYAREIERAYEVMDEIVGEAMRLAPPGTRIIVVSDHGFQSFRRGMNYNTWLVRNGFMKLRDVTTTEMKTLEDLFVEGEFFEHVDWSQTKAYAIGLGPIYINLKGREPQGAVAPGEEYEAVRRAIIEGLERYVDPVTGKRPVYKVYTREEMYPSGFDPDLVPDLRVAHNPDFRVSWQSTLGHVGAEIMEDNLRNWSADHCSTEPSFVKGIFFASWKIRAEAPRIVDIMPTILHAMGLPIPENLDGKVLQ